MGQVLIKTTSGEMISALVDRWGNNSVRLYGAQKIKIDENNKIISSTPLAPETISKINYMYSNIQYYITEEYIDLGEDDDLSEDDDLDTIIEV